MNKEELRSLIESAFEGVTLEDGISALQTQVIDNYGEGYTDEEFDALVNQENTDAWKTLTEKTLEKLELSHADAKGFRYYIPALLIRIIDDYDALESRLCSTVITSTLFQLTFNSRDTNYKALNRKQREAIAQFLYWLPRIVNLKPFAQEQAEQALHYWQEYLPNKEGGVSAS